MRSLNCDGPPKQYDLLVHHNQGWRTRLRRAGDRRADHLAIPAPRATPPDIYGHWERAERKLQAAKMEGAFPVEATRPVLRPVLPSRVEDILRCSEMADLQVLRRWAGLDSNQRPWD